MNKKIAVPTTNGTLSPHFGHCQQFAIYNIENNEIINQEMVTPPPHEPGTFPKFLREIGCTTIIAGGMGNRAQNLFAENNIEVVYGMQESNVDLLVKTFISQGLTSGDNPCDH